MSDKQNNLWMPWYIRDYVATTMHLSTEQHGALLLLLGAYWVNQGPIPDDDAWLAGTTRLAPKVWAKHRPVIAAFFTVEAGVWKQNRADAEISKNRLAQEKRREGGRKTASARWGRQYAQQPASGSSASSLATHEQVADGLVISHTHTHTHTQHTPPLSSSVTQATSSGSLGDEDEEASRSRDSDGNAIRQAEVIWAIWPKKVDTLAALIEIRHAIGRHGFDRVMEGTRAIVAADARRNSAAARGRYLPRPAEFFASSRYLDDPSQYGPPGIAMDAQSLRKAIEELGRQLAEHPGNPENTIGSLERKKAAAPEFKALRARYSEMREQLALLETAEATV